MAARRLFAAAARLGRGLSARPTAAVVQPGAGCRTFSSPSTSASSSPSSEPLPQASDSGTLEALLSGVTARESSMKVTAEDDGQSLTQLITPASPASRQGDSKQPGRRPGRRQQEQQEQHAGNGRKNASNRSQPAVHINLDQGPGRGADSAAALFLCSHLPLVPPAFRCIPLA